MEIKIGIFYKYELNTGRNRDLAYSINKDNRPCYEMFYFSREAVYEIERHSQLNPIMKYWSEDDVKFI